MITPTIDRDIPPPKPRRSYPCAEMQVGDSFTVPIESTEAVNSAVWRFRKRNGDFQFTLKSEPENGIVRVWRIAAVLAAVMLATPAYAWTDKNGVWHQDITASASQHQSQHSVARSNANASTGPVRATGGTVNNSVVAGGGGTSGWAPSITVPEGAGQAPCGGGIGLGGVGLSGGGSGGGSLWEFGDCKRIREAAALRAMAAETGDKRLEQASLNELCQIDRVRDAFGGKCPIINQPRLELDTDASVPDYCFTRNAGDRNQHLECSRVRRVGGNR